MNCALCFVLRNPSIGATDFVCCEVAGNIHMCVIFGSNDFCELEKIDNRQKLNNGVCFIDNKSKEFEELIYSFISGRKSIDYFKWKHVICVWVLISSLRFASIPSHFCVWCAISVSSTSGMRDSLSFSYCLNTNGVSERDRFQHFRSWVTSINRELHCNQCIHSWIYRILDRN